MERESKLSIEQEKNTKYTDGIPEDSAPLVKDFFLILKQVREYVLPAVETAEEVETLEAFQNFLKEITSAFETKEIDVETIKKLQAYLSVERMRISREKIDNQVK